MEHSKSSEHERGEDAARDVGAFELHLRELYLYYKARRRRGQAVLVVSSVWACYNITVWIRGWLDSGEVSCFLIMNTVGSIALAGICLKSTYRDSQLYVPNRYEGRSNGILGLLGLCFEGREKAGCALRRQSVRLPNSNDRGLADNFPGSERRRSGSERRRS